MPVPCRLSIFFDIVSVQGIDELAGTMSVQGQFGLQWTDERLSWDKAKTLNVPLLYLPSSWVFIPDIQLQNSIGDFS